MAPDPLGRSHGLLRVYKLFCWISDVSKWFVCLLFFFKKDLLIYPLLFYLFTYLLMLLVYSFSGSFISTQELFDVQRYFVYIDVCVPRVCSVSEGQKQHQIL